MSEAHEPRMLIDGQLVAATSGATFDNVDPTTEDVIGVVADGSPADMDRAIAAGAHLVTGGKRPAHLEKGYFVEPTVFADVDNSMRIAREEIFGPVLCVIAFEDDDDAVRIANDSQYGLGGAVSSASLERARGVASRIRAGVLTVNGSSWYGAASPFGGFKQSGIGRQNGFEGFEQYTETRTYGLPA